MFADSLLLFGVSRQFQCFHKVLSEMLSYSSALEAFRCYFTGLSGSLLW